MKNFRYRISCCNLKKKNYKNPNFPLTFIPSHSSIHRVYAAVHIISHSDPYNVTIQPFPPQKQKFSKKNIIYTI